MIAWVVVLLNVVACCVAKYSGRAPALPWRARRDVTTSQGVVRGFLSQSHFAFLGIPYASSPTNADRFKAPDSPPSWDGIFEATYRIKCPQTSGVGDENCLVLNIFMPEKIAECCPLPVLFHVHDGGFQDGWGILNPPSRLLEEFTVVTINYRLGTLGFLCLGNPDILGNAGLKDQVAALYWVQQNIANFGGNPNDITVYGTGSGAISVQLMLLSGMAKGLIHKVILESGSVLSPSSMTYEPFSTAVNAAKSIGYEGNESKEELVDFYKQLSVSDLTNISYNFIPCVESSYLYAYSMIDQDPMKILNRGRFDRIPMMVLYTTSKEIQIIDENYERFSVIPETFDDLLPTNLEFETDEVKYKIADMVRNFYFADIKTPDQNKIIENFKDYLNDVFMEYPMYKFATLYASESSVPVYVMRFENKNAETDGGSIEDVLRYIYDKEDTHGEVKVVVDRFVSLMTNFMKTGYQTHPHYTRLTPRSLRTSQETSELLEGVGLARVIGIQYTHNGPIWSLKSEVRKMGAHHNDPTPLTSELVPIVWDPINPQGTLVPEVDRPCLQFGQTLTMGQPRTSEQLRFWDHIYTRYYRKHVFDEE